MIRDLRFTNEMPAHHLWSVLEPRVETVRGYLACDFGRDPDEMAITRNASEETENLILGIDLKRATKSSSPTRTMAGCSPPGTSACAARAWS